MSSRRGSNGSARATRPARSAEGPVPDHLGVPPGARRQSLHALNQLLADLSALRSLYKHFHWRVRGPRFIMLHELFDKHAEELLEVVDAVAERIQMLGGEATAWPADVGEITRIPRPPEHVQSLGADEMLRELLEAHRLVLELAHEGESRAGDAGDPGTADLLASEVIRPGQLQAWFIGEHLDPPADDQPPRAQGPGSRQR